MKLRCSKIRSVSNNRLIRRRKKARHGGFTLVELMLAFFVFFMILILFGATFPVATRAGHVGSNYSQATFIAQHKVDQLRDIGFAKLDGNSLASQGLIDISSGGVPIVAANPTGQPSTAVTYSFTLTDNLVANTKGSVLYPGFYPVGSTGTISIVDYHAVNAAVAATTVTMVTVTISWDGGPQGSGSFTTHTVVSPT